MTGRTGERVLYSLRLKIFAQLQRLGLDYYERELTGRIMTRMTTDVDALSTFLQTGLVTAFVSVVTFFGIMVALLVIDVQLALVVFATLPAADRRHVLLPPREREGVRTGPRTGRRSSTPTSRSRSSGLRIVQAFRRERAGAAALRRAQRRLPPGADPRPVADLDLLPVRAAAVVGGGRAVLIVGAGRVDAGTLTTGALVAYLLYIDLFFAPVQQLSQVFDGYQQATVSLGRIQELLQEPTSTQDAERAARRACRCAARSPSRTCDFAYGAPTDRGGAQRRRPAHPGRADRRLRRRDRRRQVDPGQAGRPLLRPDRRAGSPSTAPTCAPWTSPPTATASASSRRRRTSSRAPSATPSPTAARTPPTPRWRRRPARSARTT